VTQLTSVKETAKCDVNIMELRLCNS